MLAVERKFPVMSAAAIKKSADAMMANLGKNNALDAMVEENPEVATLLEIGEVVLGPAYSVGFLGCYVTLKAQFELDQENDGASETSDADGE